MVGAVGYAKTLKNLGKNSKIEMGGSKKESAFGLAGARVYGIVTQTLYISNIFLYLCIWK